MLLLYFKISFLIGAILPFLIGLVVVLRDFRNPINTNFFMLSISSSLWSAGFLILINSTTMETAMIWRTIMDLGSIMIPVFWMHFIIASIKLKKNKLKILILTYSAGFIVLCFNIFDYFYPGLFISDLSQKLMFNFYPTASVGYYLMILLYLVSIPYSLYLLNSKIKLDKTLSNLKYILIAATLGFVGGGMAFLPTFNILIPPYGVLLFSIYPVIVGYAISRFQLFDIKVIAAELITFGIWITLFVQIFVVDSLNEKILSGLLLLMTIIFGLFLIRSVIKEVNQRLQIQILATNLQKANKRLKELDQLKSEFVSIASHQLRSPLTAIKGYSSLILEGSFGKVPKGIEEAISKIYESSRLMAISVQDFLDVSRIEQGTMKYNFEIFDLKKLTQSVVEELTPVASNAGLKLGFSASENENYMVHADLGKIKQALNNLIDNSIKYTPEGSVTVVMCNKNGNVYTEIRDTGVGVAPETLKKLFNKFVRSKNAHNVNVSGTGLGLFVVRQMIEAHKGNVWATSKGEGKGSTFHIELKEYIAPTPIK